MEGSEWSAQDSMDAEKIKNIKHEFHELREELNMGHECYNDPWIGLAALGMAWDRNRGYDNGYYNNCHNDCHNEFDSIRDLQLAQQINDGNRGVINDINAMTNILHDNNNHATLLTTVQAGDAALQRDILSMGTAISDQSLYLRGEMGRLRDGQTDIERDICTITNNLARQLDGVDRHIADRICDVEKTQIRDFAALSRQMQECCCDLKTEGLQNTMRVLDEIRCNREKDLEKENLILRGEVSQNKQNELLISYLIKSGVVPAA